MVLTVHAYLLLAILVRVGQYRSTHVINHNFFIVCTNYRRLQDMLPV